MRRMAVLALAGLATACSSDAPLTPSASSSEVALSRRDAAAPELCLTLLHNNDGESKLLPLSTLPDFGGVARFATLVDKLRAEAKRGDDVSDDADMNEAEDGEMAARGRQRAASCDDAGFVKRAAILVSSGDNFLAGPEFNAGLDNGQQYDATALDLIRYDALAIGNHEFDFGPDVFDTFVRAFDRSRAPFLSANLDVSAEPALAQLARRNRIAKSVIVRKRGEKIGIIGLTTPALPSISSPRNVVVSAMLAAAVQAEVHALQSRRVNKIILISHLQSVLEDLTLVPQLRGVDVVVAGGGSDLLVNPNNPGTLLVPGDAPRTTFPTAYPTSAMDADGKPVLVVTTDGNYKYVGRLVVGFNRDGEVVTTGAESGPVRVAGTALPDGVDADPRIQQRVVEPVQAYVNALASLQVATSEVALDGVRARIRTVETNLGNVVADALLWQARDRAAAFGAPLPVVGFQNGGGIRNDNVIPAGPLTELNTFSILPFLNFVAIATVPRAQFKELIENAVSRVAFTDGRFAQIAGFRFSWSLSGVAQLVDATGNVTTPGTRVVTITLDDGTPIVVAGVVQPGAAIPVASIDFLFRGGDSYPFRGLPFTSVGVTYQQSLTNFLRTGLGGTVRAADYPEGGEGRIVRLP